MDQEGVEVPLPAAGLLCANGPINGLTQHPNLSPQLCSEHVEVFAPLNPLQSPAQCLV